ncbi:MAG: DUF485 domain-containing protein [Candidatus Eisenbacteria bacterium]
MARNAKEILGSPAFAALVKAKWAVSIALTIALFVVYYGFILLIAYDKPALARKVGVATTLAIPVGVGVIVLAWVLTALYVVWANGSHDAQVKKLRDEVKP